MQLSTSKGPKTSAPPWQAALPSSTCRIDAVHGDGGFAQKDPLRDTKNAANIVTGRTRPWKAALP